jgi:glycosyltransferase involved in cell wall biosynthesis
MNILQLISSAGFYGAENVVTALSRDLREMGHSVQVGLFENAHKSESAVAEEMQRRGVNVISIRCNGRVDKETIRSIREIIRSQQVEVLHCHGYKADIYGYLAARRMGLPIVATCHLWTQHDWAIRVYEFLDALVLKSFGAIVAVSDGIAKKARQSGIAPQKIRVIDNGIDLRQFGSASPTLAKELRKGDKLLIGTAGRLVPQKGMQYFLRAAREILNEFPNVLFAIVGDGPERSTLEALSKELGIEKNVTFTGARSDMPNVLASLDIFVLASVDEGMPMVLLETLASGRPAIASDVGGVAKLVVPGETGILVRRADVDGLTLSIRSLVINSDLRQRLGRNGRIRIRENFSSQVMTQSYLRLYEDLLGKSAVLSSATLDRVEVPR